MNKASKRLVNNIDGLSINSIKDDIELAKDVLKGLDIDADQVASSGQQVLKKTLFLAKASTKQSRDQSLIEKFKEKINLSMEKNARLTGEILQNTFKSRELSFQFRNINDWSDDQLREVLSDADLLKMLEELDDLDNQ